MNYKEQIMTSILEYRIKIHMDPSSTLSSTGINSRVFCSVLDNYMRLGETFIKDVLIKTKVFHKIQG